MYDAAVERENGPRDGRPRDPQVDLLQAHTVARVLQDAGNHTRADAGRRRAGRERPHDPKVGRPKGAGNGVVHALLSGPVFGALTRGTAEGAVQLGRIDGRRPRFRGGNAVAEALNRRVPLVAAGAEASDRDHEGTTCQTGGCPPSRPGDPTTDLPGGQPLGCVK